MSLVCQHCGSDSFYALEQIQGRHEVTFHRTGDGSIEIERSPIGEFVKDMATDVEIGYMCSNCMNFLLPTQLSQLQDEDASSQQS